MPYATNDGVCIYYEREGSGPPLLLHHGFSLSLENWRRNGYVSALRDTYELILIDARGHGQSDKPLDPGAYAFDTRVADITAVLGHARIERAVFWGYSMGGHVGYAVLRYAPERFTAAIIGGSHPYSRDPAPFYQRAEMLRHVGMEGFIASEEEKYGRFPEPGRSQLLSNDSEALAACGIAMGDAPDFADALTDARVPVLVYAGDRDTVYADAERSAVGKARVTFVALPGLDHAQCNRASDVVTAHIRAFLAEVESDQNVTK